MILTDLIRGIGVSGSPATATVATPATLTADNPRDVATVAKVAVADSSEKKTAALRAFVDLVRAEAACKHGRLLLRSAIECELDADDIADLLQTTREERQAWAALLAHRLTRPGPGWEFGP